MNNMTDALRFKVETELALLYTHAATKDAYVATLSAAPGQSVSSAINSWFEQLASIQNRLDAAIKDLREAPRG
jgi:pectin methylesterase-like acyl-CoA thioesterase